MRKMKKLYLILTHTGTALSTIIKYYTKDEFSHVSIALDSDSEDYIPIILFGVALYMKKLIKEHLKDSKRQKQRYIHFLLQMNNMTRQKRLLLILMRIRENIDLILLDLLVLVFIKR